jgi:hypothetical protein
MGVDDREVTRGIFERLQIRNGLFGGGATENVRKIWVSNAGLYYFLNKSRYVELVFPISDLAQNSKIEGRDFRIVG